MRRSSFSLRRRLFVQALEDRQAPAGLTVNSLTDTGTGAGAFGDLRYCISQANANPGTDTITFSVAGTIVLMSGLNITGPTIIDGPGASLLVINANAKGRVFDVNTTSPVAIDDLTLANGSVFDGGGAIRLNAPDGSVSVTGCLIANNTSGVGSSGGAISVASGGTLAVDQCVLSGNSGLRGGGIYFYYNGSLSLTNSTLSGNMQSGSTGGGGAIYFYGAVSSSFVIQNTTISGNTASGRGGAFSINAGSGTFTINNSTITGNTSFEQGGGGIAVNDTTSKVELESTIVAQNDHSNAPDFLTLGEIKAVNCLIGVADGIASLKATTSIIGNLIVPMDPLLAPLAANGGFGQTHLPLPGSPLRNNGSNPGVLMFDQRGFSRVMEGVADIGAVESSSSTPNAYVISMPPITSPGATPNSIQVKYTDGVAINGGSFGLDDDIQILDPVGKVLDITGFSVDQPGSGTPRVVTYTFTPPGGVWDSSDSGVYRVEMLPNQVFGTNPVPSGTIGSFVVSMSHNYVVNVFNDEVVDTDGLMSLREAIQRANAPGSPDTITFDTFVFGFSQVISLTLGQYSLLDAMSIVGPTTKLTIDAKANSRHFAINANGSGSKFSLSNMTLINGKMEGTFPADRGGSIRIADETVTIANCVLSNNTAEASGGAIYTDSDTTVLFIQDSNISNNASIGMPALSVGSGGGIAFGQAGVINIDRTTLSGNVSNGPGGGIYFYFGGQANITNSTISGNTANADDSGGGGIYFYGDIQGSGFKITNSTISGNSAVNGAGGGLSAFLGAGVIEISNSTIVENISKSGGGLTRVGGAAPAASFVLSSTIVAKNKLNNVSESPLDISLPSAGNIAGNNNLVGVGNVGNFTLTGTGNKTGTSVVPLDPVIAPLANNGGPTQTHQLLPGSPAIDSGNNVLGLTVDQRGVPFSRLTGFTTDIGSYEIQSGPAKVATILVNDGDVQRSRVLSITVNFNRFVTFVGSPVDAFQLSRQGAGGNVSLVANVDNTGAGTTVRLTFFGSLVEGRSLINGRYTLTIIASQFGGNGFDGNGNGFADGSPTDDYAVVGAPGTPERLYRIFGDADGDGDVDAADFITLRQYFLGESVAFDLNDNGSVDLFDFIRFRQNLGGSI